MCNVLDNEYINSITDILNFENTIISFTVLHNTFNYGIIHNSRYNLHYIKNRHINT